MMSDYGHKSAVAAGALHRTIPPPADEALEQNVEIDAEDDEEDDEDAALPTEPTSKKKKKKKKYKKKKPTAEDKAAAALAVAASTSQEKTKNAIANSKNKSGVLCISRNKHWRHISAYHGPWLQLPLELLDSLLTLNLDPVTLSTSPSSSYRSSTSPSSGTIAAAREMKLLGGPGLKEKEKEKEREKGPPPPPIDPGVFRSVLNIRRLVDEASDLAVRAASGLTAFSLSLISGSTSQTEMPPSKNGREPSMSAIRTHRLRALACQRLAEAYKWDEIAASVMVMQGASALDDLAEKVLKNDPTNPDALYVHFFHEKIPSRMVAENTTTDVLDALIMANPHRLEFYRTRGVVKIFKDDYAAGARDFTHAITEARSARKGRQAHLKEEARLQSKKKAKGSFHGENITVDSSSEGGMELRLINSDKKTQAPVHPSVAPEAPLPIEPQCLFLRGSSYLQHAVWLIEEAAIKMEGVKRSLPGDGIELRLVNIAGGKYGGVEVGNPDGPLGKKDSTKARAYAALFGTEKWRDQIHTLARKSIRDHERFLAHFDQMESQAAFLDQSVLDEIRSDPSRPFSSRPTATSVDGTIHEVKPTTQTFTTYHPLLVEAHYSMLLNYLLLGDFPSVLSAHIRISHLVEGLEGYPIFLPARSMAQAEFVEIFERLYLGWRFGAILPPNGKDVGMIMPTPIPSVAKLSIGDISSSDSLPSSAAGPSSNASAQASSGRDTPSSVASSVAVTTNTTKALSSNGETRINLLESLDAARSLIARAGQKLRDRNEKQAEKEAVAKRDGKRAGFSSINIPLSGPRVEVLLAWLGATVLPDLEHVGQVV